MKVRDALQTFFQTEGVDNKMYHRKFFYFRIGFLPLVFFNPGKLHLHDLHHVALGAKTTIQGEAQVGAFEIRTGALPFLVAVYSGVSFLLGLMFYPQSTIRAFKEAKGRKNLYRQPIVYKELLEEELDVLQRHLRLLPSS